MKLKKINFINVLLKLSKQQSITHPKNKYDIKNNKKYNNIKILSIYIFKKNVHRETSY